MAGNRKQEADPHETRELDKVLMRDVEPGKGDKERRPSDGSGHYECILDYETLRGERRDSGYLDPVQLHVYEGMQKTEDPYFYDDVKPPPVEEKYLKMLH